MPTFVTGWKREHRGHPIRMTVSNSYVAEVNRDGKRKRTTCATLEEARAWIDTQERSREEHGRIASIITARQTRDALDALADLKTAGMNASLQEAAAFYIRHHRAVQAGWTVDQCWDQYLNTLRNPGDGASPARAATIKSKTNRLKTFVAEHGSRPVVEITASDVSVWLDATGARDRNLRNFRIEIQSLFNFAARWMPPKGTYQNTVAHFPQRKSKEPADAEILPPEAVRAVLHWLEGHAPQVAVAFALGCFAGLRTAEIVGGLDWKAISFAAGTIHVSKTLAKTRDGRTVKMTDNLRAWLEKYREKEGRVSPRATRLHTMNRRACRSVGMAWPSNAARHSCGTYWAILHGYSAAADQLGHTGGTAMLKKHYQGHVDQDGALDIARAYFSILPLPDAGCKVIPYPAPMPA